MQTARNLSISNFKNTTKLIMLTAILLCVFLFLEVLLQNDDSVTKRKKAILTLPENSIDVMIVGNSHAYCTYEPSVIKNSIGKRVINAGLPDQKIDVAYYTLKEILNKQNPEVVVLEAFSFGRSNNKYAGYLANVDAMDLSIDKVKACFEIFPDKLEALRMCTRLYRCHNNWKHPGIIKNNLVAMFGLSASQKSSFGDGFYKLDTGMSETTINKYRQSTTSKFTPVIDDYSIGYFKRIVNLCNERKIRLIVTMAPMNSIYLEKINYKNINEKMSAVCRNESIDYIDFNMLYNEIGLTFDDFEDAFHNAQHTNVRGAEKVSSYFADYLKRYF